MQTLYGLTEHPFALTPDPKFLYWSATHRQALQLLVRSQQRPHGLLVITEHVGQENDSYRPLPPSHSLDPPRVSRACPREYR